MDMLVNQPTILVQSFYWYRVYESKRWEMTKYDVQKAQHMSE